MKNRKALTLLLTANAISSFAQGISMLAIPWYFIDVLGKGPLFGIIYAGVTILSLFWSLYGGTLIDRYPRKNIFLSLNACGLIMLGTVSSIGFSNDYVPESLAALVFCFTILNFQLHYPTLYAFGQELTERSNYGRTNSLLEVQGQFTNIISGAFATMLLGGINTLDYPVLAQVGIQVTPWSLQEIFLMDAITYAVAISIIALIQYKPTDQLTIDTEPIKERIKTGFRFLKQHFDLFYFGVSSHSVFVVALLLIHLLLAMYTDQQLDASAGVFALGRVMYSIGALSAGVGIRWIFRKISPILSVIILMSLAGIFFSITSITESTGLLYAFALIIGLTNAGTRIMRITFLFNHIPNNVIGRTNSVFQMINIIIRFSFISLFSVAFFSEGNNVVYAYMICGLFLFLSIIPLILRYKKITAIRRSED